MFCIKKILLLSSVGNWVVTEKMSGDDEFAESAGLDKVHQYPSQIYFICNLQGAPLQPDTMEYIKQILLKLEDKSTFEDEEGMFFGFW
jgi:hypothetical protein